MPVSGSLPKPECSSGRVAALFNPSLSSLKLSTYSQEEI